MAECFWTELVKADQVCGDTPPPEPEIWYGETENGPGAIYSPDRARYAPTGADEYPEWVYTSHDLYGAPAMGSNGRLYVNAEGFSGVTGSTLDGYSGDFSDVEVDKINRLTLAVIETTPFPGSHAITEIGGSQLYCDVAGLVSFELDPVFAYVVRARLQLAKDGFPSVDELFRLQYMIVPVVDDENGQTLWPGWQSFEPNIGRIAYQYENFGCDSMVTVTITVDGVATPCDVQRNCH